MLKKIYKIIFPNWLELLKKESKKCESVLDMACGYNSPIQYIDISYKVGVEKFTDYLKQSKQKGIHNKYIQGDILSLEFTPNSYDLVLCSEVIEHLDKADGFKLLDNIEKIGRKKIIITTPNGFLKQDEYDNNLLQIHKSGWTIEEFKQRGYVVYGFGGFKFLKKEHGILKYRPYIFWRLISDISQKLVYFFPELAFQIFAVKNIKTNESFSFI